MVIGRRVLIGKLRLHTNIVRFDKNEGFRPPQSNVKKPVPAASTSIKQGTNSSHSFINMVKGISNGEKMGTGSMLVDDSPIVFVSQEDNSKLKDKFLNHEGIQSWFSSLEPCWTLKFSPEVVDTKKEGFVVDGGNVEEEGYVEKYSNTDGGNVKEEEEELMGEFFYNNDNGTPPNKKENTDAQPFNSDPFELESLIAKNGNYKSNKQGSSTLKFPSRFTQSDGGDKQHDFNDVNKPKFLMHHESKSIQSSQVKDDEVPRKYVCVSMIQQVEDTIKVGIALGFNMDGLMGDFSEVREAVERSGNILEKGIPDHRPILLKEYVVDYGPTPFRFFHSWLECKGFYDLVVDTWKSYNSGDSNGMISFKKKLQNLKQVIRTWSSSKNLLDNQMKKEHQNHFSLIDAKVDQGTATSDDLNLHISSMKILSDIDRKEASDLAQKAKGASRPTIGDVDFKQIFVEQREFLECDVSNEEIKRDVWDYGSDRASGPDGRNILDGPLVLNECMAWYRKRNKALMVFKSNFEKAFDSLRWDYLDVIMEKLGDPMSPFLFILTMEGLHALVSKAVTTGLFKGASIGHGVNVFDEDASSMALVLGCGVAKLRMMYLGVLVVTIGSE
uniref:RNA-directed DNA polymerase, eukaryota, reverse transcriptase zinc-binding domain protein n=1 Tax=Tanacetum cinerariifolium TaxID=118510 RepID=A0A6L2N168_TANCI|nr:RNA-directed DNA polymerase, eukaryota, reverse transcriptase zinc-binding domain protein [Tanacetum cinerariifolium]